MSLAVALLALVLAIPLVVALLRANELFCIRLKHGEVRVIRGRLPGQFLDDMTAVLLDPDAGEVTLRGVVEDRRVRLYPEGELTDSQKQRLRNLAGMWPVAKIRNAAKH